MTEPRAHFDAHADCLVVEVEDLHFEPARRCVRVVHWLVDSSGEFVDYDVRLYRDALVDLIADLTDALAQLTEPPTEGGTNDDTTDQGSPGGETAADDDRAGADSREVGAVVSEVLPASEEGGDGEPSAVAPPSDGRCCFVYPPEAIRCVSNALRGRRVCARHLTGGTA